MLSETFDELIQAIKNNDEKAQERIYKRLEASYQINKKSKVKSNQ